MRVLLILLGIVALIAGGLVIYAYQLKAPETEIEVVIPDDDLPS